VRADEQSDRSASPHGRATPDTTASGVTARVWARVFLPFALGYFLSYALRTANAVIAPELTRELSLSASDLGLLTSAYFFTFGAFQIPLGILLDRYGPRRVEATLLVFCAAGAAMFAAGTSLSDLIAGRALIGLGVSACLMAGFKAFHQWFPADRQASLTGAIMVSGTAGALGSSTPLEWALPVIGWRGAFWVLAGLSVVVAATVLSVPEKREGISREHFSDQWRGLAGIFASPLFWRYAPQMCLVVGGFLALQGLWAVPWMMSVDGMTRGQAAQRLFDLNLALLVGYLALAMLAPRLAQWGLKPLVLLAVGSGGAVAVAWAILFGLVAAPVAWPALGLAMCTGNLAYPLLTARFAPELSGRVNTALNLAVFVGAFGVQWGFGALLDLFAALGDEPAARFRHALGILAAMQTASFAWFAASLRRGRRPGAVGAQP
jgi:MFS family permease